jgi:signal transduction histidine kinase
VTALSRLVASTPFRLALAYMGAFIIGAALIVGFVAWRANELLTTRTVEALASEVASLREQLQTGGPAGLVTAINERVAEPGANLYLLLDANGRKVAGNLSAVPPALAEGRGSEVFTYTRGSDRANRLAVAVARTVPGHSLLIVGRDVDDQRQFAITIGYVALWGVALLGALGVGAGILVGRGVLKRVDAVTTASRQIMGGDLSRRLPRDGSGDEIDRLSASLNAMLVRIEELMTALREVSDNIAHDLKTPLTRLRSRAEAALREPAGDVSHRDALAKTMEEADELIKTFNSLLLIARLEGGAVAESMAPADLATIVGDVAELYEPVAEEAGLALKLTAPASLNALVNRELVSQAVANLVDNAIKYSAADGSAVATGSPLTVEITLEARGDMAAISVADRGPGVAPEDRERALQRFVRLEKSRSRPGAGLGLSLVAAVARMHGGLVRLEDNAPGLKAVILLPAALNVAPQVSSITVAPAERMRREPETA